MFSRLFEASEDRESAKIEMQVQGLRRRGARINWIDLERDTPLIKAIRVASAADLDVCAAWDGIADWLLFDAKGDPDGLPGGTGHSFDWSLLADHGGSAHWMLAGGLSADNVSRAVAVTGAQALDVSSGVELAPGKKDAARIQAFVRQAQLR